MNRLSPLVLLVCVNPLSAQRATRSAGVADARHTAIVEAAARVGPAVVSVNVLKRERQMPEDPFAQFFMPRGYERQVEGYGSGFIISADGVVITNQHVTEGAEQIVVTTREGADYPAKLLGEDPLTDIAVLKIDARDLPTAALGSSADLLVGEWVVAVGNPFAYLLGNSEPTITAGVVSAVGRNLLPSGDQAGVYVGMIQTDAPINPGNSGGPLADVLGRVVGVNSSILTPSGGSIGIGFAIPIERAVRVARSGRGVCAWRPSRRAVPPRARGSRPMTCCSRRGAGGCAPSSIGRRRCSTPVRAIPSPSRTAARGARTPRGSASQTCQARMRRRSRCWATCRWSP